MVENKQNSKWYDMQHFSSIEELLKTVNNLENASNLQTIWVYRGQLAVYDLKTKLERECGKSGIKLADARKIEYMIIREFRRLYKGEDLQDVLGDTLYCMSLLQHFGAPTRLLDFTYSKYVAIYFGLKAAYDSIKKQNGKKYSFALWCIDGIDMNMRAEKYFAKSGLRYYYQGRWSIEDRNDKSFEPLYLKNYDVVVSENPAKIHDRLHWQQGVLFCPGNVEKPFMETLSSMYDKTEKKKNVKKLICDLDINGIQESFRLLNDMNITEESLFPGLEGHAHSINYKMWLYNKIYKKYENELGQVI